MDNLSRLANTINKFSDIKILVDSIDNYDCEIEDIDELNEMLCNELEYSAQ